MQLQSDALDDGIGADAEQRWQTTWYTGFTKGHVLIKTLLLI